MFQQKIRGRVYHIGDCPYKQFMIDAGLLILDCVCVCVRVCVCVCVLIVLLEVIYKNLLNGD